LAGFVAVALLCGVGAAAWALNATLPPLHGTAVVPGLSATVRVAFDQDGVPWISAATEDDAAAALGYVHARDRMFQMDLGRRIGAGRLAEIAGAAALPLDRMMRTLGLRRRAVADYALLPAHTRRLMEAYARGVNAYLARRGRFAAPEFLLLGPPEAWTPIDSMLWGKTMTLYLSGNYRQELTRLALAGRLPPDAIAELWPKPAGTPAPDARLLPPGGFPRLAAALLGAMPAFPARFTQPPTASNEWAVDGRHSATGAPLLAGDPHLALGLPDIWYLARIDTPGRVLAGATAPGMPLMPIGRNAHIAWTFTTSGTDTQDVYIETPVDRDHYLGPAGPLPYVTHDEVIHVRGGQDQVLHVRETRHGPVVSDVLGGAPPGRLLSVAMAGLAPADTAAAGLDALNEAQSVTEAMAAAPLITSPNQNLMAADATHIGMAMTGRVPLRAGGEGEGPVDGSTAAFDWIGWASGAQLPHVTDPASGRLVNGNERTAPPDFPVFLGEDWYGDWRARRMRSLLSRQGKATVAGFVAMQTDVTSTFAQHVLPALLRARPRTRLGRAALALLTGWDGAMDRSRPQPLIFNAWLQRFALDALGRRNVPNDAAGPRMEFVAGILDGNEAAWCGGDCGAAMGSALDSAMRKVARGQGTDPARWRWGTVHRATFANPVLSHLPLLGWLTTRRIPASGDDATVGRAGMPDESRLDFDDVHAAGYRGVYDLADLDRSRFMIAPGQSGNELSPHVADFMRRWRDGATITLGRSPPYITATLILADH
jgi:penicillin amidase